MAADQSAAERKRKRLEAWRKRQEQKEIGGFHALDPSSSSAPPNGDGGGGSNDNSKSKPKVKIGLGLGNIKRRKKKKANFAVEGGLDDDAEGESKKGGLLPLLMAEELGGSGDGRQPQLLPPPPSSGKDDVTHSMNGSDTVAGANASADSSPKKRRRRGWDVKKEQPTQQVAPLVSASAPTSNEEDGVNDALDTFMMKLEAGSAATDDHDVEMKEETNKNKFNIDSSGSMVRMVRKSNNNSDKPSISVKSSTTYTHSDWESDAPSTPLPESEVETDDEEEEKARRAFIEALKKTKAPRVLDKEDGDEVDEYETKREVKSEKERREDAVKLLEKEANSVRKSAFVAIDTGRMYNDDEGGVMEEAERTLAALTAAPDALEVLAEMNKKKELRSVDHGSVEYLPIRKNLYIVPPSLAKLTSIEVAERRAKLKVKVRGRGAPAPVETFHEAGLSERITSILDSKGIVKPFPVQAQCLPCIMAGRDVM